MPLRLSSNDSDNSFEADDYQWAEFNLPPSLRGTEVDDDDINPLWSVDPGLG